MREYFNHVKAIVWKDCVTELKTWELFSTMFVFALLVIIIFIFSINLSIVNSYDVGPGILWVAFIFAGTIGLNRSFMLEKENGCLQGLMLTPADRTALYFGKMISNMVFLILMEAMILPLFMIFFNVDLVSHLGPLLIVIFLGTLGFCALGTLLSSLSSHLKTREIMLPILLYPLLVPVVIGCVRMTGEILAGKALATQLKWIGSTACFDIIYIGVSLLTIDHILEE